MVGVGIKHELKRMVGEKGGSGRERVSDYIISECGVAYSRYGYAEMCAQVW